MRLTRPGLPATRQHGTCAPSWWLKVDQLTADLGGVRRSAELLRASDGEEWVRTGGTALVALAGGTWATP